jgi:hypothetical protein
VCTQKYSSARSSKIQQDFQILLFVKMPPSALDLDLYKEKIISLFQTKYTLKDIVNYLLQIEKVNLNYCIIQYHLQE